MKVPAGQQVNRQTTRIVRVGPKNIFRANITTTEVKYVNAGNVFPRVSPYQTPTISTAALSKSPYNSYLRNNTHPLPLLPKLNESSLETIKMQITASNTTTTPTPTPTSAPTPLTTAATKTMMTAVTSDECVTAVNDTIEDSVRLKQSMTSYSVNGNSRHGIAMCSSVTPAAKTDNLNCEDNDDNVTSSESLSLNPDPNDSSTVSESKSLMDAQLANIGENYMEETKTPLFDPKEQEKRNRRKFYWYGSHKLIKPIKDIPLRFQLMLAETNAEKARCEGRPIILRQQMDLAEQFMTSGNTFGPDTPCFLPGFNYDQPRVCSTNGFVEKKDKSGLTVNSTSSKGPAAAVTSTTSDLMTNASGLMTSLSPITQAHPAMYTLHMYNPGCNLDGSTSPVGSTTASASTANASTVTSATGSHTNPTSSSSSACCVRLPNPNVPGYLTRMSAHSFPQAPFYFSPPAVSASTNAPSSAPYMTPQPNFPPGYPQTTALPHTFIPGTSSLGNTTFGLGAINASTTGQALSYPQYTPCISYTQNNQYTVTAVPQ
ncbi:Hypothetical predicted protein [Octopus vulgaris]|uniref:Uncharacterized protein n=2 Tax=Octopus TaxID=6643 RepID=A0AA36AVS6_OCTVU|nr:endochitinase A-like [Octopus sinensis]XP_036358804.1 endochitinase A-like [Octopus sinensis]XP_036358805.1 endochitinase A-like [Octopus sinensis]CAI9723211.1 Hypothetical predicted protein [Octopus vulgaris]